MFGAVVLGCSSSTAKPPKETAPPVDVSGLETTDAEACSHICASSAACGDSKVSCQPKCNDWLVSRSRKGVAKAVAQCAVPRIDNACSDNNVTGASAAEELVSCIGEVGRRALAQDRSPLLVAGRAICNRDSRCGGGTPEEAKACYLKLTSGRLHDGMLIFGAMKPELVQRFATCMDTTDCADDTACFGEMLGETTPPKI